MDKYFKIAAHGLIEKDGKYLITRRAAVNDYMPGFWDIPGGTIEFGEETLDALQREVAEETGLKIEIGDILFVSGYKTSEIRHQFWLVYDAKYLGGEVRINPEEHDEYRWVSIEEMADLKKIAFLDELYKKLKNEI